MSCDGCPKEGVVQSEHSPGPVGCDEPILYVLIDPDDIQEDVIVATAFKKSELQKGTLSVCRSLHCDVEVVMSSVVVPKLQRDPRRKLVGGVMARCGDIRSLTLDNKRAFCVVDDGLQNNKSHAQLGFSQHTTIKDFWQNHSKEAARGNLLDLFRRNGIKSLDECMPSNGETPRLAERCEAVIDRQGSD